MPPVYADKSCQFLITITNAGTSVAQDTTQGPYEASDDSLIGVQNNSSSSITALPLSSPGTTLFGFEADGLCDPGTQPLPSGCVPAARLTGRHDMWQPEPRLLVPTPTG